MRSRTSAGGAVRFTETAWGYGSGMRLLSLLRRRRQRRAAAPATSAPAAAGPWAGGDVDLRRTGGPGVPDAQVTAPREGSGPAQRWREEQDLQRIRERMAASTAQGMTHDDGVRMDAFLAALGLPDFPVGPEELIERARTRGAREAVLVDLRSLPPAARYGSMAELLTALGIGQSGRIEVPGTAPGAGDPGTTGTATP